MEKLTIGDPHGHRYEVDRPTAVQLQEARGYHRGERSAQRIDQSHFRAGLSHRDDRSPRLREARPCGLSPGQHAQREKSKDIEGRLRGAGDRDSTGSPSHVRTEDRGQGADPLEGVRRQDHLDVCPRHDHAGDPGPPRRDLRDRGLPPAELQRDRCRAGRSETVAGAAAGRAVSHGVSGRADGEGAGRGAHPEQGDLRGAGGESGGAEGSAGAVGSAERGSEVLAASADRAAESGSERYLHRLRRWAERISGSHRSGVSAHRGAALHCASGACFPELRALEAAQAGGRRSAIDLSCGYRERGRAPSPGTGRQMESLSQCEPGVAAELDTDYAIFQLPAGHSPSDLHHQQRGVAKPVAAQDHQNPWRIPQRRGSDEVAVSGVAAGGQEVDHADSSLARSLEPLYDSVAGTDAGLGESYAMKTGLLLNRCRGRGTAPFPGTPSPKTKPRRLHKSLDTPVDSWELWLQNEMLTWKNELVG